MENASAIAALASLSYDTRLAAIQLLASAGEEGLAAGEIARRLGVQQSTLSDHLRALAAAGVVIFDRKGRSIIYRANSKTMLDLIEFMRSTRSEEHTSELQSLMRISYAVFCLKKKKNTKKHNKTNNSIHT